MTIKFMYKYVHNNAFRNWGGKMEKHYMSNNRGGYS